MSILDLKRSKEEYLKKKCKNSRKFLRNSKYRFLSLEKFCINQYDSSLDDIIQEFQVVNDTQEKAEDFIQSYIQALEFEGKAKSTVSGYSSLAKDYLKYMHVKFDKNELESNMDYKKEYKEEKYPLTQKEIKTLLDHGSFLGRAKILIQSSSGLRISELLGLRKCDINTEYERYMIHVRAVIAKNGKSRDTFVSIEAMPYLDKILENKDDKDLIFPHACDTVNSVIVEINTFNKLRIRANLDMKYEGKNLHKITTHSFRAFFISQFEKTYSGFGHILSGHERYMGQYERFTISEKLEKYIETEKYLLIYSKIDDSKRELVEIKAKLARVEKLLKDKGISLDSIKSYNLQNM